MVAIGFFIILKSTVKCEKVRFSKKKKKKSEKSMVKCDVDIA